MAKFGGRQPGAGRPKGVPNKDRKEFIRLINKIGKPSELISKLKELANGVVCVSKDKEGGRTIYEKPPDGPAIQYLLDQAFGRARQSVEVETNSGSWEEMFGVKTSNRESEE